MSIEPFSLPTRPRPDPLPEGEGEKPKRAPTLFVLLIITLVAGALRFTRLDQPALWGDEAATYSRICGSYQDLIDILQFNGFVPLHYELYQWIDAGMPVRFRIEHRNVEPVHQRAPTGFWRNLAANKASTQPTSQPTTKPYLIGEHPLVPGGIRMTPIVMRIVPAIAGTLMVPAMYFLAIQIVTRRAALIAAIFTAGSAYLLVYSRDAKMYMHFWLFCTLSVACLLWWLRVRTRIAWLCWVAASVAMCGLHAPGAVLLAIELLIFLTIAIPRFREWKLPIYFVIGLIVILSGIGGYYAKFNRFKQEIDEGDWRRDSMLGWVDEYNQDREGPDLVRYTASAYLMSWEWATPWEEQRIEPRTLKLLHGAGYVTIGLLLLGAGPWSFVARVFNPSPGLLARVENPCYKRAFFWIIAWLVIPAYAFYCVSMGSASTLKKEFYTPGFASPNEWIALLAGLIRSMRWWNVAVIGGLLACVCLSAATWIERLKRVFTVLSSLVAVYLLCGGVYLAMRHFNRIAIADKQHWHSLWMPRYLGMIWPAFAIALSALLARLPTRPLRYGAVAFLMIVNLVQFTARVHQSEPPTETIARDMLAPAPERTFLLGNFAEGWGARPGEGVYMSVAWRYYMAELSNVNIPPQEFRNDRGRFLTEFKPNNNMRPEWIAQNLTRSPQIRRAVVWDLIDRGVSDANRDDPVRKALGGAWIRTSEQTFSAFDHWTWQKLYDLRRREYVRVR